MERLDEGQRADTWFGYPEQKHHVHMSHALTVLGEAGRVRESQQRALELSAPTSTMSRTLLSLDAATCAHRAGLPPGDCRGRGPAAGVPHGIDADPGDGPSIVASRHPATANPLCWL